MQKKHYHIFQNIRNHAYALFPISISLARKDVLLKLPTSVPPPTTLDLLSYRD